MAFAGETMCCTSKGYFSMEELAGKEVKIWDGGKWVSQTVEEVPTCGLVTALLSNGVQLTCTGNVALRSADGKAVLPVFADAATDLDCMAFPVLAGEGDMDFAFLRGVYSACGTIVKVGEDKTARVVTLVGPVAAAVEKHPDIVRQGDGSIDFPAAIADDAWVPLTATLQDKGEWLSGLLAARYYYSDSGLCHSTPNIKFARDLQLLLFSMGVHAAVHQSPSLGLYQRVEARDLSVATQIHVVEIPMCQLGRLEGFGFRHHDLRRDGPEGVSQPQLRGVVDLRRVGKGYTFRGGEDRTFLLNGVLCTLLK